MAKISHFYCATRHKMKCAHMKSVHDKILYVQQTSQSCIQFPMYDITLVYYRLVLCYQYVTISGLCLTLGLLYWACVTNIWCRLPSPDKIRGVAG